MGMSLAISSLRMDSITSAIQTILGTQNFYAPLTNSLILNVGGGSPTYTRATTATFTDFEGVLRTAIAGEARFVGARRVRNLIGGFSEDYSQAQWVKLNVTATAGRILASAGAGFHYTRNVISATGNSSDKYAVQLEVKRDNNDWIWFGLDDSEIGAYFNTATGLFGSKHVSITSTSSTLLSDGYYRISLVGVPGAFSITPEIGLANADGGASFTAAGTEAVFARKHQIENVTGQSVQTAGEYVSVGVLSAPYHGAGVDGVKYFDTDISGNPIPLSTLKGYLAEGARTSSVLQSQAIGVTTWAAFTAATTTGNNVVAPDGTTTATKSVEDSAAASARQTSQTTITIAAGESLAMSVYVKRVVGSRHAYLACSDGPNYFRAVFNLDSGTVGNSSTGGTGTYTSGSVEALPNGWYRCVIVGKVGAASTSVNLFVAQMSQATDVTASTYNGDGLSSLAWWGAGFERNVTFASTYIPTTTVAVTRNADVLTYQLSGNYLGTSGWSYAEVGIQNIGTTQRDIINSDNGAPLYISTTGKLSIYDGTSGTVGNSFIGSAIPQKVGSSWGGAVSMTAMGGVTASSGFDGDLSMTASIQIGQNTGGVNSAFGTIRNVRISTQALSATQLVAITI